MEIVDIEANQQLLAGSLNAGDQNNPTMAPEFDGFDEIMSLQGDDPFNLFGF